jgi:hypothetical protein
MIIMSLLTAFFVRVSEETNIKRYRNRLWQNDFDSPSNCQTSKEAKGWVVGEIRVIVPYGWRVTRWFTGIQAIKGLFYAHFCTLIPSPPQH